jgi:Domain of unknown function (DUF932)
MLKGISLTELARKIEGQRQLKRDYVADTATMTMQIQSDKKPVLELPDHGTFPIMNLAHDQIGARTNIPSKYYDRMLTDAPDLLAINVNTWFRQAPERRMVRTLGGDTRAFLSNRYQRIEHEQIAEAALPVLAELPGVEIKSCDVTDRRLYIHFVVPTVQGEVKVGDVVQAGGIIQNSEVGLGSVSVAGLIWRLWCLNGAKTQDTFRRNHVGRQVDEGELEWADDTQMADDKAILLKVRDMVRAVVDETRFKATLNKLRTLSTDAKVTGDPTKAVEVLAQKVGASENERGGILRALIEGGDLSAWGMLNAVTAQAHTAGSYDRAVELEAAGGSLIELPTTEWKRILEAA